MDREEIKNQIRRFILTELIRDADFPLGDDQPLITGGLIDSFAVAQIGVFVETRFNLYLPDSELTVDKVDTLSQIVDNIEKAMAKQS